MSLKVKLKKKELAILKICVPVKIKHAIMLIQS
jgi:hypothetical protein